MVERIDDADFAAAEDVHDWRVLYWGAKALFRTADFDSGAAFVAAVAECAAAVSHDPLVDLRSDSVTVHVLTPGVGLSDADLALAQAVSRAAAERGLVADPSAVQQVQLAFDVGDTEPVIAFWQAALGSVRVSESDLVHPDFTGPTAWFQKKAYVAPRNRIHLDVSVPDDQAEARVEAILAAGGRMLSDRHAPAFWSLIDVEGNVVDVATWRGRD